MVDNGNGRAALIKRREVSLRNYKRALVHLIESKHQYRKQPFVFLSAKHRLIRLIKSVSKELDELKH